MTYKIIKQILYLLTILSICNLQTLFAQNLNLDSLTSVRKALKEDTTKVNFLLLYAEQVWQKGNYDTAIALCKEGLALAQDLVFEKGMAALSHRLGTLYIDKGEYQLALNHLLEAVRIREKLGDKVNQARSLTNIGALYQDRQQYFQALEYSEKALEVFKEVGDKYAISLLTGNMGHLYTLEKQYDKGIAFLQEGIKLKKEIGDMQGLAYIYNYMGYNLLQQKKYQETLKYYSSALKIEQQGEATYLIGVSQKNIGFVHFSMQNYDSAKYYYDKALTANIQIGARKDLMELYLDYAKLDSAKGNFKNSFEWFRKHKQLSDSLNNVETNKQIATLQTAFEVEKKEAQIKSLSQENKIQNLTLIGLGLLILGMVSGGYAFYNYRTLKAKHLLLEIEQRWRRAQMNPHFFFNALSAIQKFVMQSEKLQATSYIAKFAKLMRQVLEQSQDEFTTLAEEIETIKNYIDLQLLRFGEKFDYLIEIDENLTTERIKIPSMLTQPVVENAIEHGLQARKDKGLLKITFRKEHEKLRIEIEDNGVGLLPTTSQKSNHRSFATQIIAERIKLLKSQKGVQIAMKTEEKQNESGLKVSLLLPINF
jgi:tetratricopeptide (TPR) repeat protein